MTDWDDDRSKSGWGTPQNAGNDRSAAAPQRDGASPEGKLLEKLVLSLQGEQRRSRRWGIFFKSLTFLYLFVILYFLFFAGGQSLSKAVGAHAAVIDVNGVIAEDEAASAENIIKGLRDAFRSEGVEGVILRINSPGGSPVQSDFVFMEIQRLREEHPGTPVYAVIGDLGASGAYYIAAAADEIYASRASLVGSIGVVSGGFGFVETLDKLGIERRLYTSGENKAFLDPFQPEQPDEVSFWKEVLDNTHKLFISRVLEGRGDRLADADANELFSGLMWSGDQAKPLGLIDGFGSVDSVARDLIGVEETVDYSRQPSALEELVSQFGASAGKAMIQAIGESRLEIR